MTNFPNKLWIFIDWLYLKCICFYSDSWIFAICFYWRSLDDLLVYAKNEKHLTAWKKFNQKVGNNSTVGIYHETYQVKKGAYESIYGNMPLYRLGKALEYLPIIAENNTARKRLHSRA